jgi:hypothetical protein
MTPKYLKVRVLKNENKQEWNEKKEKNREKDIKYKKGTKKKKPGNMPNLALVWTPLSRRGVKA